MSKIGFLSIEHDIDPAYAVQSVLLTHIRMAKGQGHTPFLITTRTSTITDEQAGCEVRKVLPAFQLKDYLNGMTMEPEHVALVSEIELTMRVATEDCDHIVANDLVLQGWMAPYGVAVNRLGNVKHVIHSMPVNQYIRNLGKGDRLAVLNEKLVAQAKEAYGTEAVDVIENAVDIGEFLGFQPITKQWIKEWKLDTMDYVFTYPLCVTRWDAKGVNWLALFTKYMNDQGLKAALVLLLSHVESDKTVKLDRMHFSNAMYPEWVAGVPKEVVRDFQLYSDGFMLPSTAETSSLVAMEAMLAKNTVFLNRVLKLPYECETANMLDSSNASMECTLARFLEASKHLDDFRNLRKTKNYGYVGKKLCDWICR